MKTKMIMMFMGLSFVLIAFSSNLTYAANALGINVLTAGYQPNDQLTQFNIDEYVYIGWTASAGNDPKTGTPIPANVDVSVYDSNGDPVDLYKVATERATLSSTTPPETILVNQGEGDKWCICFKADLAGSYEI